MVRGCDSRFFFDGLGDFLPATVFSGFSNVLAVFAAAAGRSKRASVAAADELAVGRVSSGTPAALSPWPPASLSTDSSASRTAKLPASASKTPSPQAGKSGRSTTSTVLDLSPA